MTGRTSPESGSGETGPAFPQVHAEIKTWTLGRPPDDHEDDAEHGAMPATSALAAPERRRMSVYSVIEIIGTSSTS
jgi:hypothetical protein